MHCWPAGQIFNNTGDTSREWIIKWGTRGGTRGSTIIWSSIMSNVSCRCDVHLSEDDGVICCIWTRCLYYGPLLCSGDHWPSDVMVTTNDEINRWCHGLHILATATLWLRRLLSHRFDESFSPLLIDYFRKYCHIHNLMTPYDLEMQLFWLTKLVSDLPLSCLKH